MLPKSSSKLPQNHHLTLHRNQITNSPFSLSSFPIALSLFPATSRLVPSYSQSIPDTLATGLVHLLMSLPDTIASLRLPVICSLVILVIATLFTLSEIVIQTSHSFMCSLLDFSEEHSYIITIISFIRSIYYIFIHTTIEIQQCHCVFIKFNVFFDTLSLESSMLA